MSSGFPHLLLNEPLFSAFSQPKDALRKCASNTLLSSFDVEEL